MQLVHDIVKNEKNVFICDVDSDMSLSEQIIKSIIHLAPTDQSKVKHAILMSQPEILQDILQEDPIILSACEHIYILLLYVHSCYYVFTEYHERLCGVRAKEQTCEIFLFACRHLTGNYVRPHDHQTLDMYNNVILFCCVTGHPNW